MNFRNILKLSVSPQWWLFEKLFPPKEGCSPNTEPSSSHLDVTPSSANWDEAREKGQEQARNATLPNHVVCKAIELKSDDTIVHNYSAFKITECGCGFGAGNEFGDYFYIEGRYVNGNPTDPEPLKEFWAFQKCPVIKLTSSIESTNSPT